MDFDKRLIITILGFGFLFFLVLWGIEYYANSKPSYTQRYQELEYELTRELTEEEMYDKYFIKYACQKAEAKYDKLCSQEPNIEVSVYYAEKRYLAKSIVGQLQNFALPEKQYQKAMKSIFTIHKEKYMINTSDEFKNCISNICGAPFEKIYKAWTRDKYKYVKECRKEEYKNNDYELKELQHKAKAEKERQQNVYLVKKTQQEKNYNF